MTDVVIDNPILNSPFEEPQRHFRFSDEGITDEVVEGRRRSGYFVPVPSARTSGGSQLQLQTQWTEDRYQPNDTINEIRSWVSRWRQTRWEGVTRTTRELLEYWTDPERDRPLFFAQREAVETAIFLTEIGGKEMGGAFLQNQVRDWANEFNPGLPRVAFKMATGTGKTTVMGMLIAWHTLNKVVNPHDGRFGDAFLVVTPGITIKDRLRVLLPNDPNTVYRERDLVPADRLEQLQRARVAITNYHAFLPRTSTQVKPLARSVLQRDGNDPFVESDRAMVRRVLRDLGNRSKVVVINDEAHHCYEPRDAAKRERMSRDERSEATSRDKQARVWLAGLRAVAEHAGVRITYDLSATPFFLKGSGYDEGRLFPWVVSDFGLIDAIESGLVKVPRVPVADDAMSPGGPTYRNLWASISDDLPKKGRAASTRQDAPSLPAELQGALHSLYGNYEKSFVQWQAAADEFSTPPVFIIVCNNTTVSKMVYDYVAGWEKSIDDDRSVWVRGELPLFSNVDDTGQPRSRFNTILVDSEQLESGEALSTDFRRIAAAEIAEFEEELRQRFPGRAVEDLEDATILREVLNTVGKPGKLGEHIRCVVSVSMLTEGWDANTVTHVLGVRAFGTQLLCEQVVGRGLRRRSYALNDDARFEPEYAEVYGVPFSFIPSSGATPDPVPPKPMTRVRALPERAALAMAFPHVAGYRTDLGTTRLDARFDGDSAMTLSAADANLALRTEMAGVAGAQEFHDLDDLKAIREQQVAFRIAKSLTQRLTTDSSEPTGVSVFPQALGIVQRWIDDHLSLADDAFVQLLWLAELRERAVDRIQRAVVRAASTDAHMLPVLRAFDPVGTTDVVDFDTTKPNMRTDPHKSHVSHVVADTDSWEQRVAFALEAMDEVRRYVKNDHLGFVIPYTAHGQVRQYVPDFLVDVDDGSGDDDLLHVIVEVSGAAREDKAAKVATATSLWVPAVNRHGGFGRWAFAEVTDPSTTKSTIRAAAESASKTVEAAGVS